MQLMAVRTDASSSTMAMTGLLVTGSPLRMYGGPWVSGNPVLAPALQVAKGSRTL
jgi:hypothetical protein